MGLLFLGIDCSTQSLSAIVVDYSGRKIVYENTINFDRGLPHYATQHGCLAHSNPLIKHSPPLMWAEALDLLFQTMRSDGVELNQIFAISGSAQQHGSVYLNSKGILRLAALDPILSLKDNMRDGFSRATSPIWMDASTAEECKEIREALGGMNAAIHATGSNTYERFTGPQVRRFYKQSPDAYGQTAYIGLISSFMASLLSGAPAPIDLCDGSGMNLLDIREKTWHALAVQETAPGLDAKLPPLALPWSVIGEINPYFVRKYGLNKRALSIVWSGDNPNSLIGLGVINDGSAAISMGTSFTYFGHMKTCTIDPKGEGHVFAAPTGEYMSLICFKNGALAIEKMRSTYGLGWDEFNRAMMEAPPGNHGGILLPYFEQEIVPKIEKAGIRRFDLDPENIPGNCRGLIEAQMLSMRLHSQWMKIQPKSLYATGGSSINRTILQVMADVFGCPVLLISVSKSAALGAALRAAHAYLLHTGHAPSWNEVVSGFSLTNSHVEPNHAHSEVYEELLNKYADCEKRKE